LELINEIKIYKKEVINMVLKIPNKHYGITELYDTVATAMGYKDVSKLHYDCKAINVARNIQEGFFAYYRKTIPHSSETDLKTSVSMLLLNYGPKPNDALEDYEVEVLKGFIC
jgi:hypothetical protein